MDDNYYILDEYLSSRSIELLKDFSTRANKSTGFAHPEDEKRWFNFIITVVDNGNNLPPDTLKEWLEADGWSEERAERLAVEFEYGISLLYKYKGIEY